MQHMDGADGGASRALRDVLLGGPSITEFLERLCWLAEDVVAGSRCGFAFEAADHAVTGTGADGLTGRLHEAERRYGDGPGREAIRTRTGVGIADLSTEQRWPEFAAAALELGVGSGLWMPVIVAGEAVGVLAMTAATRSAFGDAVDQAQAIADQAAAGLTVALDTPDHRLANEALAQGLGAQSVVDRALGIVMHAQQVSSADALDRLIGLAHAQHRTLTDVAAGIVADGGVDPPHPAT